MIPILVPFGNPAVINYQNELLRIYDAPEGVEGGAAFYNPFLWPEIDTKSCAFTMRKLRERENSSLYIRHSYAYVIVNTEDGRHMVFYKQKRGSPWMNNVAAAERGLNQGENDRKNLENIEGPNKK